MDPGPTAECAVRREAIATRMATRHLGLSGKFLWLTVPVFLVSAGVLLLFLTIRRVDELRELTVAEARQQLERDAGLLSLPMWNLDYQAAAALGQSAVNSQRARCARIDDVVTAAETMQFGDCTEGDDLARIESTVLAPGGSEVIARVHYWVDTRIAPGRLFGELQPLLMMLALLVLALVACVLFAFRRLIILPLRLARQAVRRYHDHGEYQAVPYASADELGEFVSEFNAGLTRQQSAERELQAQLGLQSALNRTLPLPLAVVDGEARLSEANPAFLREFVGAAGWRGRPIHELVPSLESSRVRELADGAVGEQQIRLADAAGRLRTYRVLSARLPGEGSEAGGWVLVFQDLTAHIESAQALETAFAATRETLRELQQTQQSLVQAEKLASLGAVVAGIAHEVNTPVGSSLTVASALEAKVEEFRAELGAGTLRRSSLQAFVDEVGEASAILQRGLHRAADQIARFKQVAADQTSSQRREFDLATVVDEVLSLLRPTLKRAGVELVLDVPPGIGMDSFPGPLGQILTNLVTNALQHGLEGVERGKINVTGRSLAGERVLLEVGDNGVGIDPEHQARVFDPFFTTKMGRGGTGLGLNLVYTMVSNLLGGTVAVESQRGSGTRFIIELPCTAPQAAERDGVHRVDA